MTRHAASSAITAGLAIMAILGLRGVVGAQVATTPKTDLAVSRAEDAPLGTSPDGVSIFTAVREQLGLKLEPHIGPVDVLVVDHAEQPTGE